MNINEQCLLKFLREPEELSDLTLLLQEMLSGCDNSRHIVNIPLFQEGV